MYYSTTERSHPIQSSDTDRVGRILVVDDDRAFGNFMLAALEAGEHEVEWVSCVTDALSNLYNRRYDLVIVDLRLPDGSGLQLLRDATDDGLLQGSAAVLLTGHDFEHPNDIRVFRKAVDLDRFLAVVGDIVAQAKRRRSPQGVRAAHSPSHQAADRSHGRPRKRIELVLYTSPQSDKCQLAIRAINQVLERYNATQVSFTICDLARYPELAQEDAVVFTPTLVKRGPGPRTWLIGNLDQPEVLVDLLEVSGVERRRD